MFPSPILYQQNNTFCEFSSTQDYRNEATTILKNSGLSQDAINTFVPPTVAERITERQSMEQEYSQLKEDVATLKEEVKVLKEKLGIVDDKNTSSTV